MSAKGKRKRVSISSKHQVTIPQVFYQALRFQDEAEFFLKDGELVLRPVFPSPEEADDIVGALNKGKSGHPTFGLAAKETE